MRNSIAQAVAMVIAASLSSLAVANSNPTASEQVSDKASDTALRLAARQTSSQASEQASDPSSHTVSPTYISIPAGDLTEALKALAKQTGTDLVYRPEQVEGLKTRGVTGEWTAAQAAQELLKGTSLKLSTDLSGALLIATPMKSVSNSTNGSRIHLSQNEGSSGSGSDNKSETTEGVKLQEIVVTAQKREEKLIDVPMSITALSGEDLKTAGIKNVRDLSYSVPSLSVLETGPGKQMITIRGIAGQRGTSSLTGIYLDEIPVSGVQDNSLATYADLRTIDLERVEVLKGPQGTLFGEGAAGGVIRFVTKDPDLSRLGGDISTEFYSTADGGWSEQVTGVVNIPLANDVFGMRLAGQYENITGWIDQPTIGREDINDSEVKHVRVKALYAPTSQLRIKGMVEIHRNTGGASNVVNQASLSDSNFRQAVDLNTPTGYTDDYDMFNLTATYDFKFAELLSSTSYAETDSRLSFTQLTPEQPVPYFEAVGDHLQHRETFSQEFRLTSSGNDRLNWTIGANYKDAELDSGRGPRGSAFILFGGTPNSLTLRGLSVNTKSRGTSKSWAAFSDASYKFTYRIEIGGGLRYFADERESFGISPPIAIRAAEFSKTTFRAYAKYDLTQEVKVYLTAGSGFRSGGFNGAVEVARGAPLEIEPETSMFYELGTKASLLNGALRLDGAIFYGEYQDMMQNRSILSPVDGAFLGYTANGQSAEIKGVEWMVGWAATDRLTLTLTGDVTDAEITEVDPTDTAPIYFLGDPVSLVPKYTIAAVADYSFHWNDSVPGFFSLGFNRKGKAYNTVRTAVTILDHQVISSEVNFLNASLGAEWQGWKASIFGRNLLDENELLYPSESGWSAQARPRTFGIAVSKSF